MAEERQKLAEELDAKFDQFVDDLKEKNKNYEYDGGLTEENIDHILNTHPAFMKSTPSQEAIDDSPLLQGLQQLQYEDEDSTPEEKALAYKVDGNWHFKKKLYKQAVCAYTEGLTKKCSDTALNATLLSNRAAANFYLQNYESAMKDSLTALKLEPMRVKSMIKCAQCSEALGKFQEAYDWAEKVIAVEPTSTVALEIVSRAKKQLKAVERDERRKDRVAKEKEARTQALVSAIRKRDIKLDLPKTGPGEVDSLVLELSHANVHNPRAQVHFEEDALEDLEGKRLVWPVLFTYPEYKISEIVEQFHEDSTFASHLEVMFGERAPWDVQAHYTLDNVELYYEWDAGLKNIHKGSTLGHVLSTGKVTVKSGTPMFIVLSRHSPFASVYLNQYSGCS